MDGRRLPKPLRLHQRTQRSVCQAFFVLLVLFPTLITFGWITLHWTPLYQQAQKALWINQLESAIGLDVELAYCQQDAPGHYLLEGLTLLHPETRREVGFIDRLELEYYNLGWGVKLGKVKLQSEEIETSWKVVHDWFVCRPQRTLQAVVIGVEEVEVVQNGEPIRLAQLQVDWRPQSEQTAASIRFQIAGVAQSDPCLMRVVRMHTLATPRTQILFKTGSTPLPCSLIAQQLPDMIKLGDRATYQGEVWVELAQGSWATTWDGSVQKMHLDRLSADLPQKLSGQGELRNFRATLRNGQWLQGSGELIVAGGGSVNGDWLRMASQQFQLPIRADINPQSAAASSGAANNAAPFANAVPPSVVHFDSMQVQFDLDSNGMRLMGNLPVDTDHGICPGAIAADIHGAILADARAIQQEPIRLQREALARSMGIGSMGFMNIPMAGSSDVPASAADREARIGSRAIAQGDYPSGSR